MKRVLPLFLAIVMIFSISACGEEKKEQEFTHKTNSSDTASASADEKTAVDLSLVSGIWQISKSEVDGKSVSIDEYKDVLTYIYNDGTVAVKVKKSKSATGTYTFNGSILTTTIGEVTSVMTVTDNYSVMTATGLSDGKKVVTTYKKIAN